MINTARVMDLQSFVGPKRLPKKQKNMRRKSAKKLTLVSCFLDRTVRKNTFRTLVAESGAIEKLERRELTSKLS